jgi:hypothetical protein
MITTDNLYKMESAKVPEPELDYSTPPDFVLYEQGLGSNVLGRGANYEEMYRDASNRTGMPVESLRQGGFRFAVEHKPISLTGAEAVSNKDSGETSTDEAPAPTPDDLTLLERRRAQMARARAAKAAKRAEKQ